MDSSTPSPRSPPPSKIEPYRGSCPNCQHGTMFPLERFHESDVRDNATVDAAVLSRRDAWFAPGFAVTVMMVSWLANLTWDRGRVERGRIKVRKARAEVLPRCPHAVICPNCYEVLERM